MNENQDEQKERYKHFRNFMTNELGITRQDIEAWTKESVATEVKKLVGRFNIEQMTTSAIRNAVNGQNFGNLRDNISVGIAKEIVKQLKVSVSTQSDNGSDAASG